MKSEDKIGFLSVELPAKSINIVNQAEIDELRAENDRLRTVLEEFETDANWSRNIRGYDEWIWDGDGDPRKLAADVLRGYGGDE